MQHKLYPLIITAIIMVMTGCRDLYDPPIRATATNYLVIEGNIDPGTGNSLIRLSRSTPLDVQGFLPEFGASVTVEDEQENTVGTLLANQAGEYVADSLGLTIGNNYKLRIRTFDGAEYLTDAIQAKRTPAIDSVSWKREGDEVSLYVNTHDNSGDANFFHWQYDETWEISSVYGSHLIYDQNLKMIRERTSDEIVINCWKYNSSSAILIGNNTQLQSAVISEAPLTKIVNGDDRLSVRYSILVHQYALDQAGYNFYALMKRNTDELGNVFSPLPSEIRGNIHCLTNPDEYVLGYVTTSTHEEQRIFIYRNQIGDWRLGLSCESYDVPNNRDSIEEYYGGGFYIPITEVYGGAVVIAYTGGTPVCVDCTLRGGNTKRPSYW